VSSQLLAITSTMGVATLTGNPFEPVKLNKTREEFEAKYLERGGCVEFGVTHVSVPCSCEDGGGPWHWAAVLMTPAMLELHFELEAGYADSREKPEPDKIEGPPG